MSQRPYGLLAELTYKCPLHCPYCSNPHVWPGGEELTTDDWRRVIHEAAALGVLHVGFSGGEPLARRDLAELISEARAAGLYTNLLTSGIGMDAARAVSLREAGLDSFQLSFQADDPELADAIAGTKAHSRKLAVAAMVREAGHALGVNVVLHRANIDRLDRIVALAEAVGAERLELANVQYYGWGYVNRAGLLPTRAQAENAMRVGLEAKERLRGRMDIFYVLPDYYEDRPKPCMQGWGRRYLSVNPTGSVLPCPTASAIPGLCFENVRERSLEWIWKESESFNRFRGTEWMPEPCQSCPRQEIDFGGCRCQAALLTGNPAATDPVCTLSPDRPLIDDILAEIQSAPVSTGLPAWMMRKNPAATTALAP